MRIGVDMGGTKIEAVALDESGRPLLRRRVPTPRDDYGATLGAIAGLVRELELAVGEPGTVGVGIPGALSPATGLVKNSNATWIVGRPLDRDLAARLGRPVRLANDANCFALSEATDGAGRGAVVVFGVILGTGCGGGVVVRGQVLTGRNAIAGEWGHNPLPWAGEGEWPGPPCHCGRRGCVEGFVSGTGLERDFREATGEAAGAREIVARAAAGDGAAEGAVGRLEDRLARALAAVVNLLDPDVIVLGGGLSNVARLYETVPGLWARWIFSDRVDTPLLPPVHGDASGARGAAWLW
ncbi:ROK family protein [Anaeromyxobacter oryzae]|uniref:N-acetylglucosamine kinase n=1 Tax=Anaeromyxobacter oryzae TaxID=2918170 RepID=A0ABM7WU33_9BACT|nr:ROK family protein [Anaeromyxobacter oryzae]BDG02979.1 N-acetylglucosamine kinase [Anaeromyxobacter oryzae]